MAFKHRTARSATPTDPEQLYRTLAGRNGAPPALWVHQGDVLRSWYDGCADSNDVAVELPTGAGKTLVGGLIGEWRRRSKGERVAYLCPTRQLAQQTAGNLRSYGLPVVLLTGRVNTWSAADRARYTSSESIAVSVYSHVFNSNPAIDDAQMLVLDDAHAAESYVSSPWRVTIGREESAYQDVLAVIASALDPLVLNDLRGEFPDSRFATTVYLASPLGVAQVSTELETALRIAANSSALNNEATYALTMMRGHIDRCLIYVSYRSLLIRPLIAPTGFHRAFESPQQRLYMSATLGAGGELERSFGRRSIKRIPAPKGWDKQGTGRRLFCFPELTDDLCASPGDADDWIADTITSVGKAVVLTPDNRTAQVFRERRIPNGLEVYAAQDVEDSLSVFAEATNSVLLLTNRYDGIDLPDDSCRLVVLQDLPARGDLQERFLYASLGALEVLQERLRARVVQGAGRATRNSGDYAVVIVAGNELTSFCLRRDVQGAMHPEVHAEIKFGSQESLGISSTDMTENIGVFLQQGNEWRGAEEEIAAAREGLEREDPPGAKELERAAGSEVAAWLAAWQGEWERALDCGRRVIDALRGGQAPQRYAALWNYLAATWAARLAAQSGDDAWLAASDDYMQAARAAGRGTSWLSHLAAPSDVARRAVSLDQVDPMDAKAVAAIESRFEETARPREFESRVLQARQALQGREPRPFEDAVTFMGLLAGAQVSQSNGGVDAAPDSRWLFGHELWVCWEAKSDSEPGGQLGATDVRQAGSHLRFVASELDEPIPSGSISVVITPQTRVHPASVRVAEDHVYRVSPVLMLDLFDRLVRAWRVVRSRSTSTAQAAEVREALRSERALPTQWMPEVMADPVRPGAT